ncbi:TPA: hypothetical protein JD320_003020 [Citrobacter koseri]|uniref:hypothetical protein n=1 Tax=Citrobacter koseri TaxID=545 RepID=UPI001A304B2E|nr:hypothetical protein [Citrobacter koseri]HDQ2605732.1 hypothetical protein [Citrobacter koseri]
MIKWIQKKFLSDIAPSIIGLFLLVKMDYTILSDWPQGQLVDNRIKLALLFIHLIMIFAILSPLISRFLPQIGSERLNQFIDLPKLERSITYIDLYDFLSGLALSAFYLSILLYTLKDVYDSTGWIVSGIYAFLMFVSSISIASLSLMRFLWLFTKFSKYAYAIITLLASSTCMAVLGVAMRMAS